MTLEQEGPGSKEHGGREKNVCPSSPFFVSGSDSESGGGDYFVHQHGEDEETPHPSLGRASGSSASIGGGSGSRGHQSNLSIASRASHRRGSRSTSTTVSSSDSLSSFFSSSNSNPASHNANCIRRMTPLQEGAKPLPALSPTLVRPISAQSLVPPPPLTGAQLALNSSTSARYTINPHYQPQTLYSQQNGVTAAQHLLPRSNSSLSTSGCCSTRGPHHELKNRSNSHSHSTRRTSNSSTTSSSPCYSAHNHSTLQPLNPSVLRASGSTLSLSSQQGSPASSVGFTTNVPEFDPYNITQFEPGSAPATASLYASYAASFSSHRSSTSISSAMSHRSSFSSSRRASSSLGWKAPPSGASGSSGSLASSGRGRGDSHGSLHQHAKSTHRDRSTDSTTSSIGNNTVLSTSHPYPSSSPSNHQSHHHTQSRNTPTQSILLGPSSNSTSRRSDTIRRPAASTTVSRNSTDSRSSGDADEDDESIKSRGGKNVSPGSRKIEIPTKSGWSWGASERMYDIPRSSTAAIGSGASGGGEGGGGGKISKLFYFG